MRAHRLQGLAWQVRHGVPFLVQLEDDVEIANPELYRRLTCYASSFLGPGSKFSLVRFLSYSEVYLTSLAGATTILRHFCHVGIRNNVDFELASSGLTLHMPVWPLKIFRLMSSSGQGYIKRSGHMLNNTLLREESRSWQRPSWCHGPPPRRGEVVRQAGVERGSIPAPALFDSINVTEARVLQGASEEEARAIRRAESAWLSPPGPARASTQRPA